ncbi:hypothetical protein ABLU38_00230 (plasmid) [Enterococcus faecalis ATCC 29212]
MEIKKAKREKIKVPIMITGASGSGKTVSALFIAKGIIEKMHSDLSEQEQWEKIGVIDTEHKRSLLYADSTIGNVDIGNFCILILKHHLLYSDIYRLLIYSNKLGLKWL